MNLYYRFLSCVLILGLMALSAVVPARAQDGFLESQLVEFKRFRVGDDRRRDNPPPLNEPLFVSVTDAGLYMDRNEAVFVEEPPRSGGQAYIYPQTIMVLHEVLNINMEGERRRTVTYSPLTGTVAGYLANGGGRASSFGTVGVLINSNRLLYDRATDSHWPQIMGMAISGPLKGKRLARFPLLWTRWKDARKRYPGAMVLSRETGYKRKRYGEDPNGSYIRKDTYYQTGGAHYPLAHTDPSIHPKERILGFVEGETAVAFIEAEVKKQGVASADYGLSPLVAIYDKGLDAVRVFHAMADGRVLHFEMAGDEVVDLETRSRWDVLGRATEGRLRGMTLERATALDSMWFAWKAFYPFTEVWGRPGGDGSSW